ncbi:MAG: YigZ family protein [Bacilli bacterium]|jgi:putative IMPACT (imprinted ancient) family translation regulator
MKLLKTLTYTEKRSRFICYLYEVTSEKEAKEAYQEVEKLNKKAKHILKASCYYNAYQVKLTAFSEDREPISSMKKLASLMDKENYLNKEVIIVRYFGGVLFGASYLDRVYYALGDKILKS